MKEPLIRRLYGIKNMLGLPWPQEYRQGVFDSLTEAISILRRSDTELRPIVQRNCALISVSTLECKFPLCDAKCAGRHMAEEVRTLLAVIAEVELALNLEDGIENAQHVIAESRRKPREET